MTKNKPLTEKDRACYLMREIDDAWSDDFFWEWKVESAVRLLKEKIKEYSLGCNGYVDTSLLRIADICFPVFAVDNASDSPRSALVESESSGEVSPRRSSKPSVNTEKSLPKGEPMLPSGGGAVSAKTMRVGGGSMKLRNSRLKRKPIRTKERLMFAAESGKRVKAKYGGGQADSTKAKVRNLSLPDKRKPKQTKEVDSWKNKKSNFPSVCEVVEKKAVTENMGIHKEWYKQADKMEMKDLNAFIKHLAEDYTHDYGTLCHAITASGLATMNAFDRGPSGGITAFQAGCIMWEFIRHWMLEYKNVPLRLVNYEDMLYPQYQDKFEKVISSDVWNWLQKEATKKLKDDAILGVKEHWESVAKGVVPFGYEVKDR